MCVCTQACLTLYGCMDCSPPGSPVCGILQARILVWLAVSYSRDLSDPGIKPSSLVSPPLAGDSLPLCHLEPAIRECLVTGLLVPGKQDCLFREIWEVPVPSLSPS